MIRSAPSRPRPRPVWRRRWIVAWALLAAASAATAGWLALAPVEAGRDAELERRLDAEAARIRMRVLEDEARVARDADRLRDALLVGARSELARVERADPDGPSPSTDAVAGWVRFLEFDRWTLLDAEGRRRAGAAVEGVAEERPTRSVRASGPVIEVERLLPPTSLRIRVLRRFDDAALDRWDAIGAVAWSAPGGSFLLRNEAARAIDADRLRSAFAAGGEADRIDRSGRAWRGRTSDGDPGTYWVAVSSEAADAALAAARRRVGLGAALAAGLAALLAWPLGRLLTRPLDAFLRAIDRIARGEADYGSLPAARDEFGPATAWVGDLRRRFDRERRRARAAERDAAWREVARQVAHDVKNPLAPIRLTVQNLQRARVAAPESFAPTFDRDGPRILEEVDRLQRLVEAFAAYAELPTPRPRTFDTVPVLEEVSQMSDGRSGVPVRAEVRLVEALAFADPDLVRQILHNLIANGQDAVAASGGGGEVRLGLRPDPEGWAVVVEDDGPCFTSEEAARAGTPGFTTKGEGRGQGLAISRRLAENQGGSLEVGNGPAGGASIVLRLPAADVTPGDGDDAS